ncbi:transcription factor HHO5-like isoform X1 [Brassica napus]|uniref:transcription factor HHO5-like isoform X1 n=1 Tax=Brassica napus TaxID=3708 RepID=UPI00207A29B7|nr:transcription factor HHO5-like isoform X1 [Brassica napus]
MKWFLCVAIERLKQEASSVQGVELKTDNKKNWMSSAQLWISNSNSQSQSTNEEENRCVTQTCNNNNANQRGAIMSFNRPPPPPPSAPLSLPKSEILTDYSSRIEQSHPIQKKELRRKWSDTTRKQGDSDGRNRRKFVGIARFRRISDETVRRYRFVRKKKFVGISSVLPTTF